MLYNPDAAGNLRQLLAKFPRAPVAHLPTPLDECPRLSDALKGPRVLIKRDDLTGLAMGGNKARQFTYSLGPAIADECTYLIHGSDSQSNQSRQTAAAAALLGMRAALVIPRDSRSYPVSGNLLLDHLLGAQVKYVFPAMVKEEKRKLIEQLRSEGHRPYDTAEDGAVLRAVAYVDCALELCEQLDRINSVPAAVYTSSRTHTLVGLTVGLRAIGSSMRAIGMNYLVEDECGMRARLASVANECARTIGLDLTFSPDDFDSTCQHAKPGFHELSGSGLEALRLVGRTEGILLDPVYTSKAMDGLISHVRGGRYSRDEAVVFLHTGGVPALFAYGDQLFG